MEHEPKPQLKEYANWQKVDLKKEGGELIRTLKLTYGEDFTIDKNRELFSRIVDAYDSAELKALDDSIWSELENTDSHDIRIGDFEKIENLIGDRRDWSSMKDSFDNQKDVEAAIIAHLPNDTYHLVSGNTRLCVAKALGIKPKVIILEFPNFN